MINCIAVDDEPLALSLLADNISKIDFLHLAGSCDSALSANSLLQEQDIDLIFIDIQMPGITGLQFIKNMVKRPVVIIVSAYKQYALDGYELDVADYLVKPVSMERFMKACNKAKELIELKSLKDTPAGNTRDHIFLNTGYNQEKIVFADILYIEGLRDYIKIHFADDRKPVIARITFKSIEEKWPAWFLRVHKSFIINTRRITSLNKSTVIVGREELRIGDAYRPELAKLIEESR